jgi:hypothetical protein
MLGKSSKDLAGLKIDKSEREWTLKCRIFTDTLHNCSSNTYYFLGIAALRPGYWRTHTDEHTHTNTPFYIYTYLIFAKARHFFSSSFPVIFFFRGAKRRDSFSLFPLALGERGKGGGFGNEALNFGRGSSDNSHLFLSFILRFILAQPFTFCFCM